MKSPAAGQAVELRVEELHVFGSADPATYPLQKKGHSMEFPAGDPPIFALAVIHFGAVFRVRSVTFLCNPRGSFTRTWI